MPGILYLCATPIGNLEDITARVSRILSEVDCIYAEDTRHSAQLLNHLGIKRPLVSCHEHNEQARAEEVAERLKNGESLAYISDAGMPGISDPGARLVKACIDYNLPYTVLPGANAVLTALVLSGLPTDAFTFLGFLPRVGKERNERIAALIQIPHTVIIYESPNRAAATLSQIAKYIPDRPAVLVREITKLYEQCLRGTCEELARRLSETPVKGECVILFGGKPAEKSAFDEATVLRRAQELMGDGMSAKDTAKAIASEFGISKNEAYKIVVDNR